MARISSQGSVVMIQGETPPVPAVILSATQAAPCVVTLDPAATAPAVGDIVVPANTTWNSIENRPFKVTAVAGQAVTLGDSDTSREVAPIAATGGTLNTLSWLELCRSTFNVTMPAGAVIDVTTLCDDAHKIVSGLPAIATWAANGFFDYSDSAMLVARDYYRRGNIVAFDVRFRDGSGVTFMANVNVFDLTLGINAAVANNLGGNISGLVSFYGPPGATGAAAAVKAPASPVMQAAA